jgi:Ni,Fe-hydrogenase maturation factor
MKISVFGNPDLAEDSAALKLIPWLKKKYPGAEIKIEDPAEGLKPADDWLIVDTCYGIDKITKFEDLDKFAATRRVSVHDYDLAMELKLLKKLGKIKRLRILAVPVDFKEMAGAGHAGVVGAD